MRSKIAARSSGAGRECLVATFGISNAKRNSDRSNAKVGKDSDDAGAVAASAGAIGSAGAGGSVWP